MAQHFSESVIPSKSKARVGGGPDLAVGTNQGPELQYGKLAQSPSGTPPS